MNRSSNVLGAIVVCMGGVMLILIGVAVFTHIGSRSERTFNTVASPLEKSVLDGAERDQNAVAYTEDIDGFDGRYVALAGLRNDQVLVAEKSQPKPALPRKMIFNADVQIVITDKTLDEARVQLQGLLKSHQAVVTQEDVSGATGTQRTGRWTIRVPAERFDGFLEALRGIGIVDRQTKKSSDVTEEFYDVEGRIKQKTTELADLTKILNEAAEIQKKEPKAKMEDYLAVRKTWEEVKANVERMEGRLKVLTNLTDLTTVTLSIQERKIYTPPETTFGGRIGQTWDDSLDALQRFGQGLVLFGVGIGPWLPVLALIAVPIILLIRRALKNGRSVPVAVAANPPQS